MTLAARAVAGWVAVGGLVACDPIEVQLFPPLDGQADAAAPIVIPPPPPSNSGVDAAPPLTCEPDATRCEQCVADESCASPSERCHPYSGACVPPCGVEPSTCPDGLACDVDRGVCVACLDSSDCTEDDRPLCNRQSGECVECLVDADCTDESDEPACLVERGVCGCDSDAQCPSGVCEIAEAHCEEPESDDDDS